MQCDRSDRALWHERHTEEVIGDSGSRVDYRSAPPACLAAGFQCAVSAVASPLVPGERFELPTNGLQNRLNPLTAGNSPSQKPLIIVSILPVFPDLPRKCYAMLSSPGNGA